MKKIWGVMAALCFVFVLAACSSSEAEENNDGDTEGSEKEVVEAESNDELTIYIVRHGKTMLNTTDRVQGWSDAVLTPAGEEVVTQAGIGLKDIDFQNAYSSDSGRAIQTAEIIMEENETSSELDLNTDERFREFNFGTYEGDLNETMWQDIADLQGITLEEFLENLEPEMFSNSVAELDEGRDEEGLNWPAEDYDTITARLTEGLDELVEAEQGQEGSGNVLLVSHGLSISALLDTYFDDYEVPEGGLDNASVSVITYQNGEFQLDSVNDMSYVEEGKK
ncbi:phosphoglycerate mutase [Oceanobacillus oncorhynchi subsp. incaldanensis]|uniref:2,3-bisphosphoglycerate-dependent phosphoglycerate mutase n=1 Tax=Oceanobacillus oncorhynchi TaxID=545501 RepID=A0A0A1MML0_9BACI|nr:histidine phosphatase family protein [Oceanobacillus oncorhynchi]GIO18027.1 phosphoglycerate mutase [Oceanobacillus oncorhynchi subsp. incaldanensis]CEI81069.1 2,3-bisphosphoglycerate-dependent phosphoglycerate mutase [Oceanobacillus oncorhynchi]